MGRLPQTLGIALSKNVNPQLGSPEAARLTNLKHLRAQLSAQETTQFSTIFLCSQRGSQKYNLLTSVAGASQRLSGAGNLARFV